jgi:murein L,D-transpeptidase YcbB/YkuD
MRTIVGNRANKTPIFHDSLEYVVLRPFWHVPLSITRNELIPAVLENPSYFDENNMQVMRNGLVVTDSIDWRSVKATDFKIRQRPGVHNSLGTVKFLFPNEHQVYFHDTNAKHYFNSWPRALSHGCIRIEKPQELAEFLLRDQSGWSSEAIASARSAGAQKQVTLTDKIPVWLVYLTCTVENGEVHFWDDVYGYDKQLWELMSGPR